MRKTSFLILSLALLCLVAFGATATAPTDAQPVTPPLEDGTIEAPAPQEDGGEALEPLFDEAHQPRQVSTCWDQCDHAYNICESGCSFPGYAQCVQQCENDWLYCTSLC